MTDNDEFTLSLMRNRELIRMDRASHAGREVYRRGNEIVWAANGDDGGYYLAQFNVGESELESSTPLSFIGTENASEAVELWSGERKVIDNNTIVSKVPPHGVKLYKIS